MTDLLAVLVIHGDQPLHDGGCESTAHGTGESGRGHCHLGGSRAVRATPPSSPCPQPFIPYPLYI